MENDKNAVTQTDEKTEGTVTEPVKKAESEEVKTFTQEEVNAMILKAENKASKKYEGIDLDKYRAWEESQKTESEKYAEIIKENETLKQQNKNLENQTVVINAKVDSKFQKFVLSEVSAIEGDFEDNLTNYLKDNPQYLVQEATETKPNDSGVPVTKINESAESGVSAILREKHPNLFN